MLIIWINLGANRARHPEALNFVTLGRYLKKEKKKGDTRRERHLRFKQSYAYRSDKDKEKKILKLLIQLLQS